MQRKSVNNAQAGVSIVEVAVWIAIAGLLIVAVSVLLGVGIGSNRFQFEQVLTTEDARRQLELMSDTLRNARNEGDNNWLLLAGDNEVGVRTDINGDGTVEQVTYMLDGNDLKRTVGVLGEDPEVRIVARSIRNGPGEPLFLYYNAENEQITAAEAISSTVERIIVSLLVNVSEPQNPDSGQILTEVKPRAEDTRTVRLWPVTLTLPDPVTTPSDEGDVSVVATAPDGTPNQSTITMADLNDGRVGTYTGDFYTNINYQLAPEGDGTLPGWYVWIGPILAGVKDGLLLETNDKLPHVGSPGACLGSDIGTLLTSCPVRQVSSQGFIRQYFPILTYTHPAGEIDYIRDILYASSEPEPTPTPTSTPEPTPTPTPTPTPPPCDNDTFCEPGDGEDYDNCPFDCPNPPPCNNNNNCDPGEDDLLCPGENCPLPQPPTIGTFTVDGETYCLVRSPCIPGKDFVFDWSVQGADQCTPSWRSGTLQLPGGSETLEDGLTGTYTINCSNAYGSVQASVQIDANINAFGCTCNI